MEGPSKTIDKLPDKILLHVFSYLRHVDLTRIASVCKKWRVVAYDSRLWMRVSLRAEYSNLHVNNIDALLGLIGVRFGTSLRYIELPCDLITPPVLHELANKCPNLRYVNLDFSNAMQLHDFNDLNSFPCSLRSLTICLSEVIFLEGFMRRVYQSLSPLEVLHLIGTFEHGDEAEEEIYEVINISKIKAHTPNLKVVNFYGISFVDDTHVELLSSNCIHLECLALNFCLRVKGSSLKAVVNRCKKLKTLLLQHCSLEDDHMVKPDWEASKIVELDITSTELSEECLANFLTRIPSYNYLALGYCEFFTDRILKEMMSKGKFRNLKGLDVSFTVGLTEPAIYNFLKIHGPKLEGLMIAGKPKLTEQFFLNVIPFMKDVRFLVMGTPNCWFLKLATKVHIDQIIICLGQNCQKLERLEVQWDPDTIRYSDNSSKFIDALRIKAPRLQCVTLSDGEYYEMVKSNFERADRPVVVRATTNYTTHILSLLHCYNDVKFN